MNKILKNYILQWELKEKNSSDPVRHCNITENGNARKFKEWIQGQVKLSKG